VLSVLYGHVGKAFYLRQLARLTDIALGPIQREIRALVKKGLQLVHGREVQARRKRTALEIAGKLVGKYRGPSDLSTNEKYLDDLGR